MGVGWVEELGGSKRWRKERERGHEEEGEILEV